ncbi:MAG: VIT domain-containing protein [bacterium]
MRRIFKRLTMAFMISALILWISLPETWAAGLLKPLDGSASDVSMKSHNVNVTINNGFARTEVDQIFMNMSDRDLEAIYSFPVPKQGSLSEVSLWIDGKEVMGEVLEKERARKTYEDQKARGNETALAEKDDYKTFEIHVYPVRALDETRVRLVYYQPLTIDLNIGRFVYQLEEGGVDEERIAFWSVDDVVRGSFKFHLQLKSAFPVKDIRLPNYQDQAVIKKVSASDGASGEGEIYEVGLEFPEGSSLSRDIVVYYRLDDDVPARVELIPYREDPSHPGTFMVAVTPGASLQRIADGTDWTFVLDKSGSMSGDKIATLADGVCKVIHKMSPLDRFRIITFDSRAYDFTGGYIPATPENVYSAIEGIRTIQAGSSTALYAGLKEAYKGLDKDRVTGIILVTDGVANIGPVQQSSFKELLRNYDIRLFTFVMGNSANEPLLEMLAKESGGFAINISSNEDIIGRIIQAKAKVLHECIYDVELKFSGEKVQDLTPVKIGNLFMGQQLVCFGRYNGSGEVEIELMGKIAGNEEVWSCKAFLPETDLENPELERLWALSSIEDIMAEIREKGEKERLRQKVVELGTHFSLVTDYTSMLVIREDEMESLGIQRKNVHRITTERQAQALRAQGPVKNYGVDSDPSRQGGSKSSGSGMFRGARAPNIGTGPVGLLFLGLAGWIRRRRRKC